MGRAESRERSSKSAFLDAVSTPFPVSSLSRSPLAFIPCAPFLSVSYTSSLPGRPRPRVFPGPPTSVHLFPSPLPAPSSSCWHPREPSELSEPLWISPYATYWAQDVLRAYVNGICKRAEWTRLSDVAFINIAAGSFCCIDLSVCDTLFYFNLEIDLWRNTQKFRKHRKGMLKEHPYLEDLRFVFRTVTWIFILYSKLIKLLMHLGCLKCVWSAISSDLILNMIFRKSILHRKTNFI